ncbi:pyrroloquinoline quinone biosynthesis protein PqqB [Saccharopolyspora rosea]|uniref:Coenzyme PQQ synthesis protein B n=1 Tax=Saccharopolyspora rosea TaxID=524884 RepID=A0ABW3FZ13_9PSEU
MWVRVLGSAAGGGFPQWNCACPTCRAARDGSRPCLPRTQSSIAVTADRRRWYLINASPDLRAQIESCPDLHPREGRDTPIRAVLLTDAEIDHTLGLLLLREGRALEVHTTPAVRETLCSGTAVLRTLQAFCPVTWRPVVPGAETSLGDGLSYRAFDVPTGKPDRFAVGGDQGRVVGYRLIDAATGRTAVYLPGVPEFTAEVRAELDDCSCLLVDGTCWRDDELLDLAGKTARDMGHLPVGEPGGSLDQLAALPVERRIYVHINNTNPMLLDDSPERRAVERRGVEVAADGLEVRL